jgi:lantibiotic modifying enzyme
MADFYTPTHFIRHGSDSFFDGRAGYICASLIINKLFKSKVIPNEILKNLAFSSVKSGYNGQNKFNSTLLYREYGVIYLGQSKGFSGILLSLLSIPSLLSDPEYESLIKEGVEFVMSFQKANGKFPFSASALKLTREADEKVNWSDGAPGVAWLLAKAYNIWKLEKYKNACIRCGEIAWKCGLSRHGSGLCYGISGNGYTFLLLYKITGDLKHLHRAKEFVKFIISKDYTKEEKKLKHSLSLFEGYSGVICFLIDVLNAAQDNRDPVFPLFFDVFQSNSERISENTTQEENIEENETDFSKFLESLKP